MFAPLTLQVPVLADLVLEVLVLAPPYTLLSFALLLMLVFRFVIVQIAHSQIHLLDNLNTQDLKMGFYYFEVVVPALLFLSLIFSLGFSLGFY